MRGLQSEFSHSKFMKEFFLFLFPQTPPLFLGYDRMTPSLLVWLNLMYFLLPFGKLSEDSQTNTSFALDSQAMNGVQK